VTTRELVASFTTHHDDWFRVFTFIALPEQFFVQRHHLIFSVPLFSGLIIGLCARPHSAENEEDLYSTVLREANDPSAGSRYVIPTRRRAGDSTNLSPTQAQASGSGSGSASGSGSGSGLSVAAATATAATSAAAAAAPKQPVAVVAAAPSAAANASATSTSTAVAAKPPPASYAALLRPSGAASTAAASSEATKVGTTPAVSASASSVAAAALAVIQNPAKATAASKGVKPVVRRYRL
jgi:hypothetical protein